MSHITGAKTGQDFRGQQVNATASDLKCAKTSELFETWLWQQEQKYNTHFEFFESPSLLRMHF